MDNTTNEVKTVKIAGFEYRMTPEFIRRINEAIDETQRLIDREMKHSPEFRKMDRIEEWQKHIAKLEGYLNGIGEE